MDTLEIRLLGRLQVLRAGRVIDLGPSRKNAALLAWLALHAPGWPRSKLIALLWPDSDDGRARANLRQALTALRRTLGGDVLATPGDLVALAPGVRVDLAAFEAVSPAAPLQAQSAALELVRGPLLDGIELGEESFDDAVRVQRHRVATLVDRLLQQLAIAHADAPQALRALAERWIELDATSEQAFRLLIEACRRLGDKAAGVKAYEQCRQVLSSAYGVSPSVDTERAYRDLLQHTVPVASAPAEAASTVVVQPVRLDTPDASLAGVARSLAEDLVGELMRFRGLKVWAAASASSFGDLNPLETARETGARYIVCSTLRPDRPPEPPLRLTVQLVDGGSGQAVWNERLVLDPQASADQRDAVVREVVAAMVPALEAHALAQSRRRDGPLSAYEHCLQGMTLLQQGTIEADDAARAAFERALACDPDYARAHTGLSLSWFNEWSCQHWDRWELTQREALRHARRASQLDPADHLALCILGKIHLYRREFELSASLFSRALRLNPNDPDNLSLVASGYAYLGQPELALELGEAAMRLNPRHPTWYHVGRYAPLMALGRHEEMIAAAAAAIGAFVDVHAFMAISHARLQQPGPAAAHVEAYLADFARLITPGRVPDRAQAGAWLLDVNPWQRPGDLASFRDGLTELGLMPASAAP